MTDRIETVARAICEAVDKPKKRDLRAELAAVKAAYDRLPASTKYMLDGRFKIPNVQD